MSVMAMPTFGAWAVVFSASGSSWARGLSGPISMKGTVASCLILVGVVVGLPAISKVKREVLGLAILLLVWLLVVVRSRRERASRMNALAAKVCWP